MSRRYAARASVSLLPLALACEAAPPPRSGQPVSFVITRLEIPAGAAADSLGPDFPSIDDACGVVAFASAGEIYALRLDEKVLHHVSVSYHRGSANQRSGIPRISRDASRLAFDSAASNLVPGPQNRHDHVFLATLETGEHVRVSQSTDGIQADDANIAYDGTIAVSRGGEIVAWSSYARNLVPQDANAKVDVFVRDVEERTTTRVSRSSDGSESDGDSSQPSISADGRIVAFVSEATTLVPGDRNGAKDVFIHDRLRGTTERITRGLAAGEPDGPSDFAEVDGTGRFVAFASTATNLVPHDRNGARDVFLFDRQTGRTERISVSNTGEEGDGDSDAPVVDATGSRIAYVSRASNLVPGDRNGVADVFLYDRLRGALARLTISPQGGDANEESAAWGLDISGNGSCVVFGSYASNLVDGDDNGRPDLFLVTLSGPEER